MTWQSKGDHLYESNKNGSPINVEWERYDGRNGSHTHTHKKGGNKTKGGGGKKRKIFAWFRLHQLISRRSVSTKRKKSRAEDIRLALLLLITYIGFSINVCFFFSGGESSDSFPTTHFVSSSIMKIKRHGRDRFLRKKGGKILLCMSKIPANV